MSEKRYFKIEYDEEWYLFDSTTISEQLVKEQAEYGYGVFANSLSPSEICDLLNEQQSTIKQLEEKNKQIGFLKRDLFILLNLIKDTNLEVNLDYKKIRERWE